jgi:hypothetical protein
MHKSFFQVLSQNNAKIDCMEKETQSPQEEPLGQDQVKASKTQKVDNEMNRPQQYQRSKDPLSGFSGIEDDMKGTKGKLDGLFGM